MNRKEKEQMISDLSQTIKGFKAIVLTNYRGLNVEQMGRLRQRFREERISYHVVKNTLIRIASRGTDLEKLNPYFEGPIAIAISYEDPVPLAKILLDFIKTQPSLEIKMGLVEGKVASPAELKALASLPSRETLLAQVLGEIQLPGNQLAGGILSVLQQVLGVIQSRTDQLAQSAGS